MYFNWKTYKLKVFRIEFNLLSTLILFKRIYKRKICLKPTVSLLSVGGREGGQKRLQFLT